MLEITGVDLIGSWLFCFLFLLWAIYGEGGKGEAHVTFRTLMTFQHPQKVPPRIKNDSLTTINTMMCRDPVQKTNKQTNNFAGRQKKLQNVISVFTAATT